MSQTNYPVDFESIKTKKRAPQGGLVSKNSSKGASKNTKESGRQNAKSIGPSNSGKGKGVNENEVG